MAVKTVLSNDSKSYTISCIARKVSAIQIVQKCGINLNKAQIKKIIINEKIMKRGNKIAKNIFPKFCVKVVANKIGVGSKEQEHSISIKHVNLKNKYLL